MNDKDITKVPINTRIFFCKRTFIATNNKIKEPLLVLFLENCMPFKFFHSLSVFEHIDCLGIDLKSLIIEINQLFNLSFLIQGSGNISLIDNSKKLLYFY